MVAGPSSLALGQRRAPLPRRRLRRGVPAWAAAGVLLVAVLGAGCAWAPFAGSWRAAGRDAAVSRRAELYLSDVGPKSRQVLDVYNKLLQEKDEQAAADIVAELDPEQRAVLKQLIEAKGGADRPITSTDPELGDTPARLHKKLKQLKDDDEVFAWRRKLDQRMLQEVQELIEVDQATAADAEMEAKFEDEAEAQQAYEIFCAQFPKPSANGKYFSTPCREADIKYRFRRMKENLGIDSATVLAIMERDASPFLTDPDAIRRTWKVMVEACDSREDALESLVLKHPGSLMAQPVALKEQITQAKIAASVIEATSGVSRFLRSVITLNGQRSFINERKEAPFGGGFPAWKRKWEQEERERKQQERKEKEVA